ncbi:MAG: FHA domain-containing protein [Gammaproteobacteria bacterium]|nr:FHA domain-containing protein [Gammaproteobacteria bacterium]
MGLRTVIQGGVGKLVNRGYVLELGHHTEVFDDSAEFSRFLKERVGVPADAMSRLRQSRADRLRREIAQTEAVYKLMLQALLRVVENGDPVEVLWRDLDISVLPDEQQWPAILFAVSSSESLPDAMKRETVERFVEYLRARKAMLQQIDLTQENEQVAHGIHPETAEVPLEDQPHIAGEGDAPMAKWPLADKDNDEVTVAARTQSRNYRRMERGKPLEFRLEDGESLPIYLSRWKIELFYASGALLLEEEGNRTSLPRGEHHVGRSSACEAVLTAAPLDVSRKHLRIENLGEGLVRLTDISTKGSWMPDEYFIRAGA